MNAAAAAQILGDVFGYKSFREGQEDIIAQLLDRRNVLAVMPTGSGKSLCYQIPALMFERPSIVVSPLKALMDDQVAALRTYGVKAACIHSGLSRDDQVEAWRGFRDGSIKLLYVSPERLMTPDMTDALVRIAPAMFVVDEAHCISKWGNSFRPEYEQLSRLRDLFPDAVIAGFTATADKSTRQDIAEKLFRGKGKTTVHGFDRPNLRLAVAEKSNWRAQLLDFLKDKEGQAGIVYCLSRKSTEEVAAFLCAEGRLALAYHAGQESGQRRAAQDRFMSEAGMVMVATIAFGMGIDKPDTRFVCHLNLPGSMEAYYQEIGRAGRDGTPAETMLLYGLEDIGQRRRFIMDDGGDDAHKIRENKRLDALVAYCETAECRRMALLSYFEEDSKPCGNCDNCQTPPTMREATDDARLVLIAIKQSGQYFGSTHIVDIVRGADNQKIRDKRHQALASYGVGKSRPDLYWKGLIRQATAGGYLAVNMERFGALEITARGEAVMHGQAAFHMRESIAVPKAPSRRAAAAAVPAATDAGLLDQLKRLRLELARARNVPAYVVFPDKTLVDMANKLPRSLDELAEVNGVGPHKLQQFGAAFLDAIKRYAS